MASSLGVSVCSSSSSPTPSSSDGNTNSTTSEQTRRRTHGALSKSNKTSNYVDKGKASLLFSNKMSSTTREFDDILREEAEQDEAMMRKTSPAPEKDSPKIYGFGFARTRR